ncbi:MAG: Cyclohexadienyl dehydrogenase [Fimbriimonadaceae bacterium]|nr:Cyclohexadienyl dehydrogenase [Fimbriimonadaceae bacterium]
MGPLGVVGIGHIGGSIAKAWLGRREVIVHDPDPNSVEQAAADGCVVADGLQDLASCHTVVIAAPPGSTKLLVEQVLEINRDGVVTDTCGVRRAVQLSASAGERFIGGHPMAGNEGRGYSSADPTIFRGAKWVLTPAANSSAAALAAMCDFVTAVGADPLLMDPTEHDRAMAQVSHLPHILANALLRGVEGDELRLAAGSFRGATRVGGSNPEQWAELWVLNREHVLPRLASLLDDLGHFRKLLESGSTSELTEWVHGALK